MARLILRFCSVLLVASGLHATIAYDWTFFDQNYKPTFGFDHITLLNQGSEAQLRLDQYSGCGFQSKQIFGSGFFRMRMKLPDKNSAGIVTTCYLTSNLANQPIDPNHDELDFEFLGGRNGMEYRLSTNVFTNGKGNREQQFHLWFDPTTDFHTYEILWNQFQIVFFVDGIPIRVFKNNRGLGVSYPSRFMQIQSSLWNSTTWIGPVNWGQGPFLGHYQGFGIDACYYQGSNPRDCYSPRYYWNAPQYTQLNPNQRLKMQNVRRKYMFYDYCWKTPNIPECRVNQ